MKHLKKELILPNGTRIENRIAKSAMSENLANKNNEPTLAIVKAYEKWSKSGTGLLITGNVMVDPRALGEPRNIVVEDRRNFDILQQWAATATGTGTHLWAQINHPGRQALEQINKHLVAPSAVPLKVAGRKNASKKIPKALTETEIYEIIQRYANTAAILKDAGFTGVQIHGAHGYLVNQFLSPLSNIRQDKWGGSIENRARFVLEILRSIRKTVGKDFPIGIKLNSADFQRGGFTEEESMEVVKMLSTEGIDLIEISGGNYEAPAMIGKESTQKREAYFMDYVEKAKLITDVPLILTGGFRTVSFMDEAVASNKLDMVGIARPFCVYPDLANDIFNGVRESFPIKIQTTGVGAIDQHMELIWYEAQIWRLSGGKQPKPELGAWSVFFKYMKFLIQQVSRKSKRG